MELGDFESPFGPPALDLELWAQWNASLFRKGAYDSRGFLCDAFFPPSFMGNRFFLKYVAKALPRKYIRREKNTNSALHKITTKPPKPLHPIIYKNKLRLNVTPIN
jgi:hypothetical protein